MYLSSSVLLVCAANVSTLSCQRRCVFGLSKLYGVGVWLFSKKG